MFNLGRTAPSSWPPAPEGQADVNRESGRWPRLRRLLGQNVSIVGCACARIMVSWVMRAAVAFAVLLALASPPVRAQVALYDSLLHEAAATGDIELIRYLLDGGAAVDARAALDGVTPLHSAARSE